jgi:hypothetical protein
MNKIHNKLTLPVTGALLFATAVSAEQDQQTYLDSTNRVTLSLRFGLNITGKFKGIGGKLNPLNGLGASGGTRRTPHGDPYNYDDGYVYPDISGSHDGLTWYWGYDNSSTQVSGDDILFHRTTASGIPSQRDGDSGPNAGAELTYDRELGIKEDWHHMRYGIEAAVNYMPISFSDNFDSSVKLTQVTDAYPFTPGTTPPTATPSHPYQGSFGGPGFVIGSKPVSSTSTTIPGGKFGAQNSFDANLWGLRLGPYVEFPFSEKFSLHLSGGLAIGLLNGNASWGEMLTTPGKSRGAITRGGGDDLSLLWGFYVGADATYQFNKHWGVDAGVQFQDLGVYDHSFGGRGVEVDLSRSLFVQVGVSYSF